MIVFNRDTLRSRLGELDSSKHSQEISGNIDKSLDLNNIDFESEESSKASSNIDFESSGPISFSFPSKEPPGLYQDKDRSLFEKFKGLIVDPGIDKDKAANIANLSDMYGISPSLAEKHYDELKKQTFEGTYPTSRDVASGLMTGAVATGIIFNPVATAIGVGSFMGLDELENYIISKVEGDPYQFQEGKGLSDLLEAHGLSKDAIDLLDFTWKIPVAGGTTKFGRGIFGAITTRIKGFDNKVRFINKVVEDVKTDGITPDEAAVNNAEEFGIDKDQVLEAQKGKDLKVETESNEIENPLEITRPSEAIPSHTFTSQKGNHYEKIGEKWYDSKGKEVTNRWVIKAAENKKVEFGVDETATEEKVIKDIESKFDKRIEEVTDEEVDKYYAEKDKEVSQVKEAKLEPETEDGVAEDSESIKFQGEKSPFFQTAEEAEVLKKLYAEKPKAVRSDPELLTQKLLNDVNLWYHGDNSIDIAKTRGMLDALSDSADDFLNMLNNEGEPYFIRGDHHLEWKETVTEAADWARGLDRIKIERTDNKDSWNKLYSGIDLSLLDTFEAKKKLNEAKRKIKKYFAKDYEDMSDRINPDTLIDNIEEIGWWDRDQANDIVEAISDIVVSGEPRLSSDYNKFLNQIIDNVNDNTKKLILSNKKEFESALKKSIDFKVIEGGTKLYSGIPLDEAKKLFDKGRKAPKATSKPSEPFSVKSKAKEILLEHRSNLNLANYETNKFINSINQKLNSTQREAMPFVIEGTEVPKELNRLDLEKVINKDSELLKGIAKEIKQHFEEGWQKIKKHIPDLSVKQIEDYVTHLWDVPKHKRAEATSWFQTQNRFLEKRFIDTYKEGIERGFKPKVLDINEIIRIHDSVTNRTIENTKYINSLLKLKDDGIYLIQRTGTAPMDWIEVDYSALTRRIPLPKKEAGKKGEFVKELRVRVHPDLVRPLKAVFEQRFDHPVISAYEAINGLLKKSMLSISLFHHGALGETGAVLIGPGKTARIMFDPVKIYKSLAKGEYDVFEKEPIARDSIEHGVQYGATADIPVGKIQGYLNDLAKATDNTLMINRITKFMRDFNSVWDKALWNYLHDTLKLYGYESLVSKLDPNMGPEATRMAKREIGQMINDTFGGQNWDQLMMTPKEVQMLTWSLLSADWTFSTTRQALAPTGIGSVYKESADVRKKLGWRFWARAALYFGVGINALNVLFRTNDMKKNPQYYSDRDYSFLDKTMYGNTVGKKTKLFVGRYKDGSERYIRWGKQFIDFYELLASPIKKIGGKVAPIPSLISEIGDIDDYGKKKYEVAFDVFKKVAEASIPFALRRLINENIEFKPSDIFMPSSKGMSRYRALEYFKKAIVDGDEDLLREVYEGALRNNLPAFTLFNGALSWTENEVMADVSKNVEDIKDAEMKLNAAGSAYDKRRYGIILRRLNKEKADKEAGLKLIKSAMEKMKVYSDLGGREVPRSLGR